MAELIRDESDWWYPDGKGGMESAEHFDEVRIFPLGRPVWRRIPTDKLSAVLPGLLS